MFSLSTKEGVILGTSWPTFVEECVLVGSFASQTTAARRNLRSFALIRED